MRNVTWLLGLASLLLASAAQAAPLATVLNRASLIVDATVHAHPGGFADALPLDATADSGAWTYSPDGLTATWSLTYKAEWSKSMSLHASELKLPTGAYLWLSGQDGRRFQVNQSDLAAGQWWSRTVLGQSVTLEAVMPSSVADRFAIRLVNVFAGFRLPFSEYAAGEGTSACAVNYQCKTGITNQGNAAIAFTYRNAVWCSGTLVNNTSNDRKMLVMTAGHCRISELNQDATSVVAYWKAHDACGSTLRSADVSAAATSSGATTRVIKGTINPLGLSSTNAHDAWLFEMNGPAPAGITPYWVGFDANDALPGTNAYGVHHGGGRSKQYVGFATATTKFDLDWTATPSEGDVYGGASGSALFNSTGRLIGVLSGSGSGSSCPAPSAGYKRLGVFYTDVKPYLDPSNTGAKVIDGIGPVVAPTVDLQTNKTTALTGESATLTWVVSGATSCTATGSWSGSKAASGGSESVSLGSAATTHTFGLSCTGAGGTASDSVSITVSLPPTPPSLSLSSSSASVVENSNVTLTWTSADTTSCTAGGSWSGSKAVSGSQSVNVGAGAGSRSYDLTCTGPGGNISKSATVTVTATPPPTPAPTLTLSSSTSTANESENITLTWSSADATSCAASGSWSGSKAVNGSQVVNVGSGAGSRTYGLACTGAGGNVAKSASVTVSAFSAAPPSASLSTSATSVSPGAAFTLGWVSSNATACSASGAWSGSKALNGTELQTAPSALGSYGYSLTCSGPGGSPAVSSVSVTVVAGSSGPSTPGTGSAEEKGGGGSMPPLLILVATAALFMKRRIAHRNT